MKNTKQCPKCSSKSVASVPNDRSSGGWIQIGMFRAVSARLIVCCDCGYAEQWVEDPASRATIRKRYLK